MYLEEEIRQLQTYVELNDITNTLQEERITKLEIENERLREEIKALYDNLLTLSLALIKQGINVK